jgi:acyl-coenzyme A synthetase/AMP-(fatty) acid ligase
MTFDRIFGEVASAADSRPNILTDGQATCTYEELPGLLDLVRDRLREAGVSAADCTAVECINSVPGALLLLALMRDGASFIVTPPAANSQELKPTPHFCRWRITVLPASGADPRQAAECYRIEANPQYNGREAASARLYLRTSGSMGASKIVSHTHERMIGNAMNCVRKYGFSPAARAVVPVPIAHMYGFGAEFLPAILSGASIDLQERTNLLKYLDREKRFQPTIAFVTPAVVDMLRKGFKTPRTTYHVMVTSGQRISEELFRAFDPLIGGRLVNQYGSTEMGATAACDPGDPLDWRATAIGRPMEGVDLRIDAVPEEPGTTAGTGLLYCRHPFGFEGYLDENGDWISRASADGWYRTGDLVTTLDDGSVTVLGRADASVNRSGYLVLLSDIERILEKLEAVGEVAVVAGRGETRQGQRIAAFCVPRPGSDLDGAHIRQRCFDLLPHYAIPDEVRVIEELPKLASGKLDRQSLTALVN